MDLAKVVCILGEFFRTCDFNLTRKHFSENSIFYCPSDPIHGSFPVMGFIVVPLYIHFREDQSEQLKNELWAELGGAAIINDVHSIDFVRDLWNDMLNDFTDRGHWSHAWFVTCLRRDSCGHCFDGIWFLASVVKKSRE